MRKYIAPADAGLTRKKEVTTLADEILTKKAAQQNRLKEFIVLLDNPNAGEEEINDLLAGASFQAMCGFLNNRDVVDHLAAPAVRFVDDPIILHSIAELITAELVSATEQDHVLGSSRFDAFVFESLDLLFGKLSRNRNGMARRYLGTNTGRELADELYQLALANSVHDRAVIAPILRHTSAHLQSDVKPGHTCIYKN